MFKDENPYEGINFYPQARPETSYGAMIGYGKRARVIGFFPTLAEAIRGRANYIKSLRAAA